MRRLPEMALAALLAASCGPSRPKEERPAGVEGESPLRDGPAEAQPDCNISSLPLGAQLSCDSARLTPDWFVRRFARDAKQKRILSLASCSAACRSGELRDCNNGQNSILVPLVYSVEESGRLKVRAAEGCSTLGSACACVEHSLDGVDVHGFAAFDVDLVGNEARSTIRVSPR